MATQIPKLRIVSWRKALDSSSSGASLFAKLKYGAAPESSMTHTAIQESLNGKVVNWMEKISDNQYCAKPQIDKQSINWRYSIADYLNKSGLEI